MICFTCERRTIDAITLRQEAADTFACLSEWQHKSQPFLSTDHHESESIEINAQTMNSYVIVHEQNDDDSADEFDNLEIIESCDGGDATSHYAQSNNSYEGEGCDDADDDQPAKLSVEELYDSDAEIEDAVMLQFKNDLLRRQNDGDKLPAIKEARKQKKPASAPACGGDDERKHLCNVCQKKFLRRSNLIDHLRLHANERLFKCTFCDKSFVQAGNLKAHMRVHTKERPYECQVCGKTYNQSSALKVHYRSHTNERNYKCADCAKAFTNASDLKKHQRVHNPDLMFKCEHCERRFAQRGNLRVHVANNHGTQIAISKSEIDLIR